LTLSMWQLRYPDACNDKFAPRSLGAPVPGAFSASTRLKTGEFASRRPRDGGWERTLSNLYTGQSVNLFLNHPDISLDKWYKVLFQNSETQPGMASA
jgi:hypothetical protein